MRVGNTAPWANTVRGVMSVANGATQMRVVSGAVILRGDHTTTRPGVSPVGCVPAVSGLPDDARSTIAIRASRIVEFGRLRLRKLEVEWGC